MGESIVAFIKVFCEKIWFWLIIAIASVCSLFSQSLFIRLGFDNNKRWLVGIVAIISSSLSIQHICDWLSKYNKQKQIIKNIDILPEAAKEELKSIINNKKKTLKLKLKDNMEQRRIVEHFCLEVHNNYATFPDYLWKELNVKFGNNKSKSKSSRNWLRKVFKWKG